MTLPRLTLLAALLLTACSSRVDEPAAQSQQEASAAPAPTAQAPSPASAPVGLHGEYRVAGVDGEDLNAPIGIAVSITEDTIELAPCAGFAWTYAYEGGRLDTKRIPGSPDGILCRITEETARVGAALGEAERVTRTPANGLEFSGGGRSVLLFSQ